MKPRHLIAVVIAGICGWLFGGWFALVAAGATAAVAILKPEFVVFAMYALPMLLAFLTVSETDASEQAIRLFASDRPRSHDVGLLLVLVWVAASWLAWRSAQPEPQTTGPGGAGSRPVLWLIPFLMVALGVVALTIV